MGEIAFTQYVLPRGQRQQITIDRPEPVYSKAMQIIDAGFFFECEVLRNGMVSLTIGGKSGDHAIKLSNNGPAIPNKVDEMILGFDLAKAQETEAKLNAENKEAKCHQKNVLN